MKKQEKIWLKDKCGKCDHERGKHNEVDECTQCYEENKDYIRHKFTIKKN